MNKRMLIFEIGTEEIPAAALYAATERLLGQAGTAFDEARIPYDDIRTYSTPRRIVVSVDGVADSCEALVSRAKGPAVQIAYDDAGEPTKAAIGFARGKGVDVTELVRETDADGKEYVYAIVEKPAEPTLKLLPELLSSLVAGISWPKSQRWGSGHITFSRPIRWLLALLGDEVVGVEYAGLVADRVTRGHRLMAPQEFTIDSAETYAEHWDEMRIVPSAKKRAGIIRSQINAFESETGLKTDTPKKTFDEVVNLVEYPTVIMGHFDERFLDVPPEIITDAMLEHQRYFPMYRPDGTLDNAFLLVGNGDPECTDTIREGNERVVRARLSDAAFFVDEDRRNPLEHYVAGLDQVVFQEQLGSVRNKVDRVVTLATGLCDQAGIAGQDRDDTLRTALLCKADLITSAVVEFTSLQGVMGGHYALSSGETEAVALAVTDHYRPRFSGDELPRNLAGKVVALADKLDTICGLFAIGQGPTGSSDPFALRRSAIGIVAILFSKLQVSLVDAIDVSLGTYAAQGIDFDRQAVREQVIDFFMTRTKVMVRDAGNGVDAIDAVLAVDVEEPMEFVRRVRALESARQDAPETFENLATAYARANNLRDADAGVDCDESLFGPQERALDEAVSRTGVAVSASLASGDYATALGQLSALRAPIDAFFEDVLVMDEDAALRTNRLRLLNRFVAVFADVADIGKLEKA